MIAICNILKLNGNKWSHEDKDEGEDNNDDDDDDNNNDLNSIMTENISTQKRAHYVQPLRWQGFGQWLAIHTLCFNIK